MKYLNNLKKLRESFGISQSVFSKCTGLPIRTIQHYEQGSRDLEGAKLETLLIICNILNCKLDELFVNQNLIYLIHKVFY